MAAALWFHGKGWCGIILFLYAPDAGRLSRGTIRQGWQTFTGAPRVSTASNPRAAPPVLRAGQLVSHYGTKQCRGGWACRTHLCGRIPHRLDCLEVTVSLLFSCQGTSSFPFRPCCVIIIAKETKDVNLKVLIRKTASFTLRQDQGVVLCLPKWACMCRWTGTC